MEQPSSLPARKEVAESSFEYMIAEILNMDQPIPVEDAATAANSVRRLESIGYDIGYRMAERLSHGLKYVGPDPLDLIKFICKEFWEEFFRKKIDKLQTNHKGVFVLTDTRFRWLEKYSSDDISSKQAAARMLTLPCGVIRGALANMGVLAIVNADFNNLPSCTFNIRMKT